MANRLIAELLIILVLMICAFFDVYKRVIPNACVALLFVLSMVHRWQLEYSEWLSSSLIFAVVLLIGLFAWERGWLGGGDVKLYAIASFIVFPDWERLILITALCSGFVALGVIFFAPLLTKEKSSTLPLGAAIAAATTYLLVT